MAACKLVEGNESRSLNYPLTESVPSKAEIKHEMTLVVLAHLVEAPRYKAEGCGFDFW